MASGIDKWKQKVASMQRSNQMRRVKDKARSVEHTVIAAGASYLMGSLEKRAGASIPSFMGLDPKLTVGGLLALLAATSSGRLSSVCGAASDGLLANYAYAQGLGSGYTIRGEDDDDGTVI